MKTAIPGKHPHRRGEDEDEPFLAGLKKETPPQAWGRPAPPEKRLYATGNTPTGVGKTQTVSTFAQSTRKHPHRRGEDPAQKRSARTSMETPPQAWGRHFLHRVGEFGEGNTPTGVGKTSSTSRLSGMTRKHPHRRGEDPCPSSSESGSLETPPQAWGRPRMTTDLTQQCRNTPTGVGKTKPCLKTSSVR